MFVIKILISFKLSFIEKRFDSMRRDLFFTVVLRAAYNVGAWGYSLYDEFTHAWIAERMKALLFTKVGWSLITNWAKNLFHYPIGLYLPFMNTVFFNFLLKRIVFLFMNFCDRAALKSHDLNSLHSFNQNIHYASINMLSNLM